MADIIINGILVLFGTIMTYMLLWRVLLFDTNREPDPMAIDAFVSRCKRGGSLDASGEFGALKECFDDANGNPAVLRKSLERFRRLIQRFHNAIEVVANAAIEIGLLGTVLSLILNAGGKDAVTVLIGLGMMSTMYGLIIAIPAKMFHGLTHGRVLRFLDHVDAILEALDWRINPPTSPALVPSPNNSSPPNGRPHKRMAEDESRNGHHARHPHIHSKPGGSGLEPVAAKSLEVARLNPYEGEETAVEYVLAADANFGARVLDWVGDPGDVTNETTK